MDDKKDNKIQITEIFTAKAGKDWSRYFHGTITREKDENGQECLVRSKIYVKTQNHDGYIIAIAENQWVVGEKLDELVLMILDKELHDSDGAVSKIFGSDFNHN